MNPLSFTTLALAFPNIDPVLIKIGPLSIHWYGMMYVIGILLGWFFAKKLVSSPKLWPASGAPITKDNLDDFLTWAIAGIIVGGRLGYVVFYNLSHYLQNPLSIPALWDGGMSFHGGALGTILAMFLFARRQGYSPFSMFDVVAASSCFGIFFGRIANFINAELWGHVTDVAWAVQFPLRDEWGTIVGVTAPRHPSQLYEAALEGALLFIILAFLVFKKHKLKTPGFICGTWVLGYALSRIVIEFVRQPDDHIGYLAGGWLTMGMVLSLPMVIIGLWSMKTSSTRTPWHSQTALEQEDKEA